MVATSSTWTVPPRRSRRPRRLRASGRLGSVLHPARGRQVLRAEHVERRHSENGGERNPDTAAIDFGRAERRRQVRNVDRISANPRPHQAGAIPTGENRQATCHFTGAEGANGRAVGVRYAYRACKAPWRDELGRPEREAEPAEGGRQLLPSAVFTSLFVHVYSLRSSDF